MRMLLSRRSSLCLRSTKEAKTGFREFQRYLSRTFERPSWQWEGHRLNEAANEWNKSDRSQKGWEKGTDLGSKGHTPEGPGVPKFYYDNVCIVWCRGLHWWPVSSHAPYATLKKWKNQGVLCWPQGHDLQSWSEAYTKPLTQQPPQT